MKKKLGNKIIIVCMMLVFVGTCAVPGITGDLVKDVKNEKNNSIFFEGNCLLKQTARDSSMIHKPLVQKNSFLQEGNTLITETFNGSVIEIDMNGTIVWQKSGLGLPVDVDRLSNGNTLIAEASSHEVIEVDSSGTVIWNYTAMTGPFDADRLVNGNTLIADTYGFRVIEVDSSGTIVWEKTNITCPLGVERLKNGSTLIAVVDIYGYTGRIIEVDSNGVIQWEYEGVQAWDAKRLTNGNTLIADFGGNHVIEITSNGTIVWEKTGIAATSVQRLSNGNTLIGSGYENRVIEVDASGSVVWEITELNGPFDADRIIPVEFVVKIKKGLGITATIENIGTADATNVEVNIKLTGGIVFLGKAKKASIDEIKSSTTKTVRSIPIGFGKIAIEATVICDQGVQGFGNATGFLLIFFIV